MQPSRQPQTDHTRIPRRYRRIIEQVRQHDNNYFARHPDETEYIRDYVPGEAWPFFPEGVTHVHVIMDGDLKHRGFLCLPPMGIAECWNCGHQWWTPVDEQFPCAECGVLLSDVEPIR